jgi:hypothetical protein
MDIDDIVEKTKTAGKTWATHSAAYHRYDKGFKTKFAKVKSVVRATKPPNGKARWTRDDLEDYTFIHEEWTTFMEKYHKAYEDMITAKTEYDTYRAALDASRSKMATEREEIRSR